MGGRLDWSQFLYDSKLACPFNCLHKGLDLWTEKENITLTGNLKSAYAALNVSICELNFYELATVSKKFVEIRNKLMSE